jgi:hypothetical protein
MLSTDFALLLTRIINRKGQRTEENKPITSKRQEAELFSDIVTSRKASLCNVTNTRCLFFKKNILKLIFKIFVFNMNSG